MAEHVRKAVRMYAAGRVVIGLTMAAAPDLVATPWVGDDAQSSGARVVVRSLGARDAALGAGTLASTGDTAALRRWLIASSACDAADFLSTLAGPTARARSLVLAFAAGGAIAGAALAASV